jgi:exosome complex component RRP4
MVSLIKNATGCKIIVGQNGVIWIDGEPKNEVIAIEAIRKIEEESHTSGLTDRMTEYLESKCGKFKQEQEEQPQEEQ